MAFTNLAAKSLYDRKQYKCGMLGQPRNVSNSIDFGPSAFSYLAIKPAQ
jgi:hypothetical protein